MTSLKEILESKSIPKDLSLSSTDLLALVKMHKGLLKENERNMAFWRSTNENLESVTRELEKTNRELREVRDQLWGEMQLAKKIQTVLLPRKTDIRGYQITAYMNTADEVGGDYYDVINIGGRDWIVIGDVSGHGVSAGLVMMMVQTSIHAALHQHNDLSPSELLTVINRTITENIQKMEENQYMTIMVLAVFEEGRLVFSGLHQDIILYRACSDTVERIESMGMWLGMVNDLENMMQDRQLTLHVGDTMLLFTDGITEARKKGTEYNAGDQQTDIFGEQRLIDIVASNGNCSPEEIRDCIIRELEGYQSRDDVTMVVIKRVK